MCAGSVLSSKNRKHMRKIIFISLAVLLLAGAGIATVAFSGPKATPEAQSVKEYIQATYPGAKLGHIAQEPGTTTHQYALCQDAGIKPSDEDVDRFLADTDAVIGQLIEAEFTYAGSDYLLVCFYEDGREKICHRFPHIVSK
jgi:hypothetical protein